MRCLPTLATLGMSAILTAWTPPAALGDVPAESASVSIVEVPVYVIGKDGKPVEETVADREGGLRFEVTGEAGYVPGETATPLAVVLTRLRTDPLERWRSDPEPTLRRRFTVDTARSVGVTVTLGLDERAELLGEGEQHVERDAAAHVVLPLIPLLPGVLFLVDGRRTTRRSGGWRPRLFLGATDATALPRPDVGLRRRRDVGHGHRL